MRRRRIATAIAGAILSATSVVPTAAQTADSTWTPWVNGSVARPQVPATTTFKLPEVDTGGAPRCYARLDLKVGIQSNGRNYVWQHAMPKYDCPVIGTIYSSKAIAERGEVDAATVRFHPTEPYLIYVRPDNPGRLFFDYWMRNLDNRLAYVTLEVVVK